MGGGVHADGLISMGANMWYQLGGGWGIVSKTTDSSNELTNSKVSSPYLTTV